MKQVHGQNRICVMSWQQPKKLALSWFNILSLKFRENQEHIIESGILRTEGNALTSSKNVKPI